MSIAVNRANTADGADPARAATLGAHPASVTSLRATLDSFITWLDRFGETSYDHQSYFAGPIGGRAKALYYRRRKLGALAVAPMVLSEALLPSARRLFWKSQRFPIADAHYAMGFAFLAQVEGSADHYLRAVHFLTQLESTRCAGYRHAGWGYPFDWVTRNGVMAAQTPLITSTPYVYEAFAAVHALDDDRRWLATMESAAEHAWREIPDHALSSDEATCAYNPHDTAFRVINASAYRACLLFKAAKRFGRDDFASTAQRNLNYVLRAQQPDGSWRYATDGIRDFVDHFHTCFVLKALAKIETPDGGPAIREAIERGVAYYVKHLFDEDGLPRPFAIAPRLTIYRHELYDYAECINIAILLRGRFPALDARLASTLQDLFARWRKVDGSFRSRRLIFGWDNVPMHRWAQSQIFRSLAYLHATQHGRTGATLGSNRPAKPHRDRPILAS
jgi:hypothetical protein